MRWLRHILMTAALATVILALGRPLREVSEAQSPHGVPRMTAFCDGVSEIPRAECESLVALYTATNGDGWTNRSGWLQTTTPCSWFGVECSAGHVQSLALHNNVLRGTLPTTLDALSALETLDLGGDGAVHTNELSGTIPTTLGNLAALRSLDLTFGLLSGPIPRELGNLSNLSNLRLDNNQLNGPLPLELTTIAGLQVLSLASNQLTGTIPVSLAQLSNLRWLDLPMNQLTGPIPPELGNLSKLEWLRLGGNRLTGTIPPELGRLSRLTELQMALNQLIGGIPPELGNLSELISLNPSGNPLGGSIPPELGKLSKLETLALDSSDLSGAIPPEMGNLHSLRHLFLNVNRLSGALPVQMANLVALQTLWAEGNQLSGPIPPWLGNLTNLEELRLSVNRFEGAIPAELGNLTKLNYLGLADNALEGEMPASLTNLTSLRRVEPDTPGLPPLGFGYNMLYSNNPAVAAFLDGVDPIWAATQTLPPTDVRVTAVYSRSVQLSWSPIVYTGHGGYYQVGIATTPYGPFIVHGTTISKTETVYLVTGLIPETTYYLRVRTYTPPHYYQQNALLSLPSQVVSVTLPVPEITVCSCLAPGDPLLSLDAASFRPYTGTAAASSPLIRIPSPPAPMGWNQPGFVPDVSWRLADAVWWSAWEGANWRPAFPLCAPIGLLEDGSNPQGVSGTTHLIRHAFTVSWPDPEMQMVRARLEMWSDNKSEWWWQGEVIASDREANVGAVELYPDRIAAEGGSYLLAVQSSNDLVTSGANPQGTAARLCVTWRYADLYTLHAWLPMIGR